MASYRAHRLLAGTGDNPSNSGVTEKVNKRVGSLGKLVQASFFDDAEEVRIHMCICTYINIPVGSMGAYVVSSFCLQRPIYLF